VVEKSGLQNRLTKVTRQFESDPDLKIFPIMSCCKECPYKVDNNHNRKLREFTERTGRKHTCHMVNPKLWDTSNEKEICKNFV
jgi:hypothetical protein